ncbi:MAG: diguanylate cyclase [Acidimicrobiaceae bacterium]|jgi:diguanylate cyclase (GGDEF)-like protein
MTASSWVGEERRARLRVAPALPYVRRADAIAAILDDLEGQGLGHWTLAEGSMDDQIEANANVMALPILVPDGPLHFMLLGDRLAESAPSNANLRAVLSARRLIATLLSADVQADRLLHRAVRAERESMTDSLTALPNGRSWWRSLAREASRCDRHQLTAVVAVVDLDDLKRVNDNEGHLAGDLLLRTVAGALTDSMRGDDVVARLGGDEFGVLGVDYQPHLQARLVNRLHESLAIVGARASIGVALYEPGGFIDETFDQADRNMYEAKRAARAVRTRR